jgi:uncharacterized protein YeeX (DUF496 family)
MFDILLFFLKLLSRRNNKKKIKLLANLHQFILNFKECLELYNH